MSRFTLVIAKHDTEPHTARYDDVVRAIGDSLKALGHELTGIDDPGRLIMWNMNNVSDPAGNIPEDAILFNTEQTAAVSYARNVMTAYETHRDRVIWDYSEANARVLRDQLGMKRVVVCPIGYIPTMTTIEKVPEQDIDVLFVGALSPSRQCILSDIERAGLKLKVLYGMYGKERDKVIARSKVVLNLHYGFEHKAVFEIFRVSHLLANHACVVTEAGGCDPALESLAKQTCAYVPRARIVETCKKLVDSFRLREMQAAIGFSAFTRTNMVDNVRIALEQS